MTIDLGSAGQIASTFLKEQEAAIPWAFGICGMIFAICGLLFMWSGTGFGEWFGRNVVALLIVFLAVFVVLLLVF